MTLEQKIKATEKLTGYEYKKDFFDLPLEHFQHKEKSLFFGIKDGEVIFGKYDCDCKFGCTTVFKLETLKKLSEIWGEGNE